MNLDACKEKVAAAGADWHAQVYCSYLPPDQQQRVKDVIHDVIVSALFAYEGLIEDVRKHRRVHRYPIPFSEN